MTDIVDRLRKQYAEQFKDEQPAEVIYCYQQERFEAADEIERLRAALTATEASGFRIVPVEPDNAQCAAGETAVMNIPRTGVVPEATEIAQDVYAAMLAAAPKVTT